MSEKEIADSSEFLYEELMADSRLARRLTLKDATVLGLGSMIGAGIFASPAAMAAGSGLLIAIVLAGLVAYLNATSMAQLAALYPESGGTYAYGRKQLGPFLGFIAGWAFVIGKTASCTAMALTFGYYALPSAPHVAGVAIALVVTAINYFGVKKTVGATKIIVSIVLLVLFVLVGGVWAGGEVSVDRIEGVFGNSVSGVLEAAGLMFFAFAGYARVATMGEEVMDPQKNIPRAILFALGLTVLIYTLILGTMLVALPTEKMAESSALLAEALAGTEYAFLAPLVRFGAALACFGVLLSLIAGISRTTFAMASNRDLPHFLSAVHPVYKVPHKAEILVGSIVAIVVAFADLRTAIGFSSFAILTYYAISNLSALKLVSTQRLFPKFFALAGFAICVLLAINLPGESIFGGCILLGIGALIFKIK